MLHRIGCDCGNCDADGKLILAPGLKLVSIDRHVNGTAGVKAMIVLGLVGALFVASLVRAMML